MTPTLAPESAVDRAIRGVSYSARSRGIVFPGAPGVGKSRFFGRVLAIQDFVAEIPQVIIDPIGGTIDNFLDKVVELATYMPRCERRVCRAVPAVLPLGHGAFLMGDSGAIPAGAGKKRSGVTYQANHGLAAFT
jgi:hypothetical protein